MRNTKSFTYGFTLIEVLITIGIVFIVSAAAYTTYHGLADTVALRDSTATVLHALEESRNRASVGVGEGDHGVFVDEDRIVIFEGPAYIPGEGRIVLLPFSVVTDQVDGTEFVFSRLSGKSSEEATVVLTQKNGEASAISVTYEGLITQEE